jgi:plasmid stability protein
MTEVRIRNVDEWVVEALRHRARANGQSLERTVRDLMQQEAMRPKQELADEFRRMREELQNKHRSFSDSTALIREERDARG